MTWGRQLSVKAGNVIVAGQPPYGYALSDDGKHLVVYEPEAQIVCLVFTWYTEGDDENGPLTLRGIARKLNAMQVPTPADNGRCRTKKRNGPGEWAGASIAKILGRETYAGVWHYNKHTKRDIALIAVDVPPIVSRNVWEAARRRLALNRKGVRREPRYEYLVDAAVWEWGRSFLSHPAALALVYAITGDGAYAQMIARLVVDELAVDHQSKEFIRLVVTVNFPLQ